MRRNLKLSLSGFLSYVSFFLVFVILNLRILSLSTHISLVMCQIGSLVVESHIFLNLKKIIFFTNLQSHSFFFHVKLSILGVIQATHRRV